MLERPMNTTGAGPAGCSATPVASSSRRDPQAEDVHDLVDRAGGPDPVKMTTVSSSPPTASRMICAGVLPQPGGLQAGAGGLGVRVGVARAAPRRG
jgi:hypothetical protein